MIPLQVSSGVSVHHASLALKGALLHIAPMAKRAIDLAKLRELPVAERLQLVEDLWDTIIEDAPDEALPLSPELAAELDRRLAEHEADPAAARPWAEIRAEILGARRPPTR